MAEELRKGISRDMEPGFDPESQIFNSRDQPHKTTDLVVARLMLIRNAE